MKQPFPNIKIDNLSIGYISRKKQHLIASNISFSLEEGCIMGIVGSNGIGKTTLLKTLNGNLPSISGNITYKNKALNNYSPEELAKTVSIVTTESPNSKNLTVWELVSLGRHPYTNWLGNVSSEDIKQTKNALLKMEIDQLSSKKCYEISDGQLQKVLVARALAQDTPIIQLDEPTTHLDLYHKIQLLKLLKTITRQDNKTILFTTHDIESAIQLCDKMLVLTPEECFFGSPKELILNNRFNSLFPKDTIVFDAANGSFKIVE